MQANLNAHMHHISSLCPQCQYPTETTIHCCVQCPFSKKVWCSLHLPPSILHSTHTSFIECMTVLAFKGSSKEVTNQLFQKVSLGCWLIWCARNVVCFNAIVVDSFSMVNQIYRVLQDLHDSIVHHPPLSSSPPPPGVI